MHLVIAPHPDDAPFSCGGYIHTLTRRGQPVTVYAMMSGFPQPEYRPHTVADELHTRWGLGMDVRQVIEARRAEDTAAVRTLGADIAFGAFSDCIYRVDPQTGRPLYINRDGIFGDVQPQDVATVDALESALIATMGDLQGCLYAPLAVGHHVDHQLGRDLGFRLAQRYPALKVYFYEDYPYAREGRKAVLSALQEFGKPLLRVVRPLDESALDAKARASACYVSQIDSFWPDSAQMRAEFNAFAEQMGGEGMWRLLREDTVELAE